MSKFKYFLLTILFLISFLLSPSQISAVCVEDPTNCNNLELCPAPPGECSEGNFTVAAWSGEECSPPTCGVDIDGFPYCDQICSGEGQCCYDIWNYCCTPGKPPPGSPVPTSGTGPTPTPTTPPPVTPPPTNYQISGNYRSSSAGLCTAASTALTSLTTPNVTVYNSLGNAVISSTASGTGYSFPLPSGQTYSIRLTIPAAQPYVCACGTSYLGNNKVCQISVTPTANNDSYHFYLVPTTTLSGSFYTTVGTEYPSATNCSAVTNRTAVNLSSSTLRLRNSGGSVDIATRTLNSTGNYTFTGLPTNQSYDVYLDLDPNSNYICSCPSSITADSKRCAYLGISPTVNNNYYMTDVRYSSGSWYQIFGGNILAANQIQSAIPYLLCSDANSCISALIARNSNNNLSSGFPLVVGGDRTAISSTDTGSDQRSYIHQVDRSSNLNSYGVQANINSLSYLYLLNNLTSSPTPLGDGSSISPTLNSWKTAAWWQAGIDNYVSVNGNLSINESQNFDLTSTDRLIVFVSGDLTFDDSIPTDADRRITSVAEGGILVFIVQGNVFISPNVGYQLNPTAPTVPAVTIANSNLSAVLVSDSNIIIQSKSINPALYGSLPDRKLIVAGTLAAWGEVQLNRLFAEANSSGAILNSMQATENILFRPDFVVNWPNELKTYNYNWQESNPQQVAP